MPGFGRRIGPIGAIALALLAVAPARAAPDCSMRLDSVADAPRFEAYRAQGRRLAQSAAPNLSTREARRYRSLLGAEAAQGPNFAGNFTIAAWGCGAACTSFAIIDARSGRVVFPVGLGAISTAHVGGYGGPGPPRYDALRFTPDSRLLVVLGAPGEDERREGAAWYEWTGTALRLVRFVPRAILCGR